MTMRPAGYRQANEFICRDDGHPRGMHQTAWHALQQVRQNPDVSEIVYRERAVWNVHARGLFTDVRAKRADTPALVAASYAWTQPIGTRLAAQHPGLVAPSARRRDGACLAAFVEIVLSNPRLSHYLTYQVDPIAGTIKVEREPGSLLALFHQADFET